jgi:FMN phosphatase YigB (HAD superfamily)
MPRRLSAALFDFGDTLFHRRGGHDAVVRAARRLGVEVEDVRARELWAEIQARARTAEELAKGRDLSAEAHRACWLDLYRAADTLAPGMAEVLYEFEIAPDGWVKLPETDRVLTALRDNGVPVGVVSDTGFDVRPLFAHHGLAELIGTYALSFEHGAAKPSRRLFEAACSALGVSLDETLMVGDNPLTDGGAMAHGLTSLLLPHRPPGQDNGLGFVLQLVGVD